MVLSPFMKIYSIIASVVCCVTVLNGCGTPDNSTPHAAENVVHPTQEMPATQGGKTYAGVRGQIVKVSAPAQAGEPFALEIDHESIPNFMAAMRMTIPLQNAADAKTLKAGDKIRFDLVLSRNLTITNVQPLPAATKLNLAAAKTGATP